MLTPEQIEQLRRSAPTGKNRLDEAMRMAGLTQEALADVLGITQPYVSRLERGAYQDIPLEMCRRIADVFGCAIEDLFPARQEVAS